MSWQKHASARHGITARQGGAARRQACALAGAQWPDLQSRDNFVLTCIEAVLSCVLQGRALLREFTDVRQPLSALVMQAGKQSELLDTSCRGAAVSFCPLMANLCWTDAGAIFVLLVDRLPWTPFTCPCPQLRPDPFQLGKHEQQFPSHDHLDGWSGPVLNSGRTAPSNEGFLPAVV